MTPARRLLVVLLLGAATLAVYAKAGSFEFVQYDDPIYVLHNPHLESGLGWESLRWAFTEPYETNWIPLTWLSLVVDYHFFGLDPSGYHWVNVVLHAISTGLLFWVLSGWTGAPGRSAFVAAVFALHPLHIESVAWVSERKDCLAGVFWMLGMAAYAGYVRRPGALRYAAVLACLTLGLLAKPLLVTFPFALLLLDLWPLRRLQGAEGALSTRRLGRAVLEKVAMLPIVVAFAAVTYWVQRETGAMSDLEDIALGPRIENAALSVVAYLKDIVWPRDLAVFYPYPSESIGLPLTLAAAALVLVVSGLSIAAWRSRAYLTVGWLWFLGTLVPMIGLVQVGLQSRADRYMYIPLVGLSIAVAWGVWQVFSRSAASRAIAAASGACAVLAMAVVSHAHLEHWRDTERLFGQALRVTEGNFIAHHGLGRFLLDKGDVEAALPYLAEAARIKPRWPPARASLGDAMAARGDLDSAILNYREAVQLNPTDPKLRIRFGKLLIERGWPEDSLPHFAAALREMEGPERAAVQMWIADAKSQSSNPRLAQAAYLEAEATLRESLEAQPERPELHLALADALRAQQREAEAADAYRKTLEFDPDNWQAANNLAWMLATSSDASVRDPAGAVAFAEQAMARAGDEVLTVMDTLAVAQAADGERSASLATLDRAIESAREAGATDTISALESRRSEIAAGTYDPGSPTP